MLNSENYNRVTPTALPQASSFFYQNDPRWKDIQIVETRPYTLGSHGCLITSLTNAFNDSLRSSAECKSCYLPYSPDMMLGLLKQHKAINSDGLVVWSAAEEALSAEIKPFDANIDYYYPYHIVQYCHCGFAHFSNVLEILDDGTVRVYNVWNGSILDLLPNQCRRYIDLRFHK